jgi:hypothetical protein
MLNFHKVDLLTKLAQSFQVYICPQPVWEPCKHLTTVSCTFNKIERAFKNTLTISRRFFQQVMLQGFVKEMHVRYICYLLDRVYVEMYV